MVYKSLNNLGPDYLSDLVSFYTPGRTLRSENKQHLVIPKTRLKTFGDKAFEKYAPVLWNDLPIYVRSAPTLSCFKKSLKTFLFNIYYGHV